MGAYDLQAIKQSDAARVLPAVASSTIRVASTRNADTEPSPTSRDYEQSRIARFVGFAWIAALLLIINACFEQFVALTEIPQEYLSLQMIQAACQEAAISAIAVVALACMTATAKSRFASIALILLAGVSGTSAASHGWEPNAVAQWASAGFCALAAFAAALSARGAFASHAPTPALVGQAQVIA